jgi:hypothetical protein
VYPVEYEQKSFSVVPRTRCADALVPPRISDRTSTARLIHFRLLKRCRIYQRSWGGVLGSTEAPRGASIIVHVATRGEQRSEPRKPTAVCNPCDIPTILIARFVTDLICQFATVDRLHYSQPYRDDAASVSRALYSLRCLITNCSALVGISRSITEALLSC